MNNLPNADIREYAQKKHVELWRVSERCGYAYSSSFTAYLRKPLDDEQKKVLREIIDEIADELEAADE